MTKCLGDRCRVAGFTRLRSDAVAAVPTGDLLCSGRFVYQTAHSVATSMSQENCISDEALDQHHHAEVRPKKDVRLDRQKGRVASWGETRQAIYNAIFDGRTAARTIRRTLVGFAAPRVDAILAKRATSKIGRRPAGRVPVP